MGPPILSGDGAAPPQPTPLTPLYGGALLAAIPPNCTDVAASRPVPDHQEVWGDAGADQSVVFEIVEHDPSLPDADAAAFYFADQATQNEASASSLTATHAPALTGAIPSLAAAASSPTPGCAMGATLLTAAGTQAIAKGRSTDPAALNEVDIALAVLRLPAVASDLLVVVNTATVVGEASSVASVASSGAGRTGAVVGASAAVLGRVLGSLRIEDWGLFGGMGGE